jgi:hypothetical protein
MLLRKLLLTKLPLVIAIICALALLGRDAHAGVDGSTIAAIALANVGKGACSTPSQGGGTGFDGSCSKPNAWCADFAKWVWGTAGAKTTGLNANASSFYTYGQTNGTWHSTPSLGDAVVFDSGVYDSSNAVAKIAHVAIVVQVNANGTIVTVGGNTGSSSCTSCVVKATCPSARDTPLSTFGGYTILGFASPVGASPHDPCEACGTGDNCGTAQNTGATGTLYHCVNGVTSSSEVCPNGCTVEPIGTNDICTPAPADAGTSDAAVPTPPYTDQNGVKRHIVDGTSFGAWGFVSGEVAAESVAFVAAYPTGDPLPASPTVVKASAPEVWVIDGSVRRRVANPQSLTAWKFSVTSWSDSQMDAYPQGADWPQAPYLIQGAGEPEIYVLDVAPSVDAGASDAAAPVEAGTHDAGARADADTRDAPAQGDAGTHGAVFASSSDGSGGGIGCSLTGQPNVGSGFAWLIVGVAGLGVTARRRRRSRLAGAMRTAS